MRFFACTIDKVLIRFFLMMACVIGGLFAGQPLIVLLALPLFLSAMLGISFMPEQALEEQAKQVYINPELRETREVA